MITPFVRSDFSKPGLALLEFFHPAANCLSRDILLQLRDGVRRCSEDKSLSVLELKSAGDKAFCAGADLGVVRQLVSAEEGVEYFKLIAETFLAIIECPLFVVARAHGRSVGGGVGLLAACDYVVATESSHLRLSELEVGLAPFLIQPILNRRIGRSHFTALALDTQWRTPEWGRAAGLFARVVADAGTLDSELEKVTEILRVADRALILEFKKQLQHDLPRLRTEVLAGAELSGKFAYSNNQPKP